MVGTKSFGKGSVQTIIPFKKSNPEKSITGIRLTTARYYTPSGVSIQGKGISPDIIIEQGTFESNEFKRFSESDLKDSLDSELNENTNKDSDEENKGSLNKDYQLERALELIHAINIYQETQLEN